MKNKSCIFILLFLFSISNCLAIEEKGKAYSEVLGWWKEIHPFLEKNIEKFNSYDYDKLKKFRGSVNNLERKTMELNKSFENSLSIDRDLIKYMAMYCNAVREITSLAGPFENPYLSMALGFEYSLPVLYFYKNVKNENGVHIGDCDDSKWHRL